MLVLVLHIAGFQRFFNWLGLLNSAIHLPSLRGLGPTTCPFGSFSLSSLLDLRGPRRTRISRLGLLRTTVEDFPEGSIDS